MRNFNITENYVDKDDLWSGNISAAAFKTLSTPNRLKVYSPGQLAVVHDMILRIKYKAGWELIRHRNQAQNNKDNIHKNIKRVDHNYKVIDKVMLNNSAQ